MSAVRREARGVRRETIDQVARVVPNAPFWTSSASKSSQRSSTRPLSISNRHPRLRLNSSALKSAIARLDAAASEFRGGCPPGELSIVFLTDAALAHLHGQFLNDPTVTDVITFEGDPAHGQAGEICVSADAAARQRPASKPSAFSEELSLYLVHGWLHLAGYDDLAPARKRAMRAAESRAMTLLRKSDAMPSFDLK